MARLIGCSISVDDGTAEGAHFMAQLRHYEELKDRIDRKETGWIELDHVHGDGRLLIRIEDIRNLFKATESYVQEADHYDAACRAEIRAERIQNGE